MKSAITITCAVAILLSSNAISAQEKKLKQSELPAAVAKTAAEVSKGATVRGYAQEKEDGETVYEVMLTVNGHSRDVQIDTSGNVKEIEEQVEMDKLPAAVKSALLAKAGTGKITSVESLTKKDKLVAYEAQVTTHGKKSEVQVGPSGETLNHEE
jgi:uncharacterized membrane protein YkoI